MRFGLEAVAERDRHPRCMVIERDGLAFAQPCSASDGDVQQSGGESCGIGVGSLRRQDGAGARDPEPLLERAKVQKGARKARPPAQRQFGDQIIGSVADGEIERVAAVHLTRQSQLGGESHQPARGGEARLIGACRAVKAVEGGQAAQRVVDLPKQHGRAGKRTALGGIFTIDNDDFAPLPRETLGDKRAGDAGADDEDVATKAGGWIMAARRRAFQGVSALRNSS